MESKIDLVELAFEKKVDSSLLPSGSKEKVALDTNRLGERKMEEGFLFQCCIFSVKLIIRNNHS